MLTDDDLKFAIEDARARHEASVELIYFNEGQAMSLLGIYTTVAVAAASSFAAGVSGAVFVPLPMALALLVAALVLTLGCYFCVLAMKPANISLPGSDADFWISATSESIPMKTVAEAYLQSLDGKNMVNDTIMDAAARSVLSAKVLGAIAPAAAILIGLATWGLRLIGLIS